MVGLKIEKKKRKIFQWYLRGWVILRLNNNIIIIMCKLWLIGYFVQALIDRDATTFRRS